MTSALTKPFLKKMNRAEDMTLVTLSLGRLILYHYDSSFPHNFIPKSQLMLFKRGALMLALANKPN